MAKKFGKKLSMVIAFGLIAAAITGMLIAVGFIEGNEGNEALWMAVSMNSMVLALIMMPGRNEKSSD